MGERIEGRKVWGGKGGICVVGFRGVDATDCIVMANVSSSVCTSASAG